MDLWRQASFYWNTLRYLRLVQFYSRARFYLWRPRPNLAKAPLRAKISGPWHMPARRLPSMVGPGAWVFLNTAGHLDGLGWDGPQREKLWRYNQHYFDDLNAQRAGDRMSWHMKLLDDWVMHNPPGQGVGWEPYPLSLRVVNWIKWVLGGGVLTQASYQSLAIQVRWLTERLENHLLGNHLFANAKALVMAGLFFEGPEADGWLAKGSRILAYEIPEQFLSDGGHFERSTMYHSLALEDMLDLINAVQCFAARLTPGQQQQVTEWPQRIRDLFNWLLAMTHPDGKISFFNDATFGISPSVAELKAYADRLSVDLTSPTPGSMIYLKDSGYVRLTHGKAVAILDVAPIGPDYLPGHAHADTLSFELSVGIQRVLVNSGTSCYGSSHERLRQRGTAAHNTVVVNEEDSSEVWGGFRVARRAYPLKLNIQELADEKINEVRCAHNGYTRLPGEPIHHRTWRIDEGSLNIIDKIEGPHQSAVARFHFHPAIKVQLSPSNTEGIARLPNGSLIALCIRHGQARLENSTWHPRFGDSQKNICLAIELIGGTSILDLRWDLIRS